MLLVEKRLFFSMPQTPSLHFKFEIMLRYLANIWEFFEIEFNVKLNQIFMKKIENEKLFKIRT